MYKVLACVYFTVITITISGMICMFSLILILIDWYNAWNEPIERVRVIMLCVCFLQIINTHVCTKL